MLTHRPRPAEASRPYARAHWLVVDEIGPIPGDEDRAPLAKLTEDGQAGIVDATRDGNTVALTVYRVTRLRLLLSPEAFDFSRPVRVILNGREIHNEVVPAHLPTLLKWAGIDQDRTMMFVAELEIDTEAGVIPAGPSRARPLSASGVTRPGDKPRATPPLHRLRSCAGIRC